MLYRGISIDDTLGKIHRKRVSSFAWLQRLSEDLERNVWWWWWCNINAQVTYGSSEISETVHKQCTSWLTSTDDTDVSGLAFQCDLTALQKRRVLRRTVCLLQSKSSSSGLTELVSRPVIYVCTRRDCGVLASVSRRKTE